MTTISSTQIETRSELEDLQFRKLTNLLHENYTNNPFYRALWDRHGVTPDEIDSLESFRELIPFTDKQMFLEDQATGGFFGSRLGVPRKSVRQTVLTSGTSGIGQEAWGLTASDVLTSGRGWVTQYEWIGLEPGDVAYFSFPVAFFSSGLSSEQAARMFGLQSLNLFGIDRELAFNIMEQLQPNYVYGAIAIPTTSAAKLDFVPRERFHEIKGVQVPSLSREMQKKVAEHWGAPAYEIYGSTQASSACAGTCRGGLGVDDATRIVHFFEDTYLIECLDRTTGSPAEPGAECEIIVTTLDREASPAIRYRMHDRAVFMPHTACQCGRIYNGYAPGTIGRWDDMMKIKGINVWPSTFDHIIMADQSVFEYRGTVKKRAGRDHCTVRIHFDPGTALNDLEKRTVLDRLTAEIKRAIFISVEVVESDTAFESFGLKPKRWKDERRRT